ncbi:MAG: hypothetical protein HY858_03335 [Candidatus Solibacter usitatus]|nr:hypothetical protein [Candidatus Solibacter usitatus]
MFTWICPQCGSEVPPSYSECPACVERRQQAGQPAEPPPPPPPQTPPQAPASYQQPAYQQPPVYQQPPQPQYAPPPQAVYTLQEQKKGMPTWLVALLTIAVLGGALFGVYRLVDGRNGAKPAPKAAGVKKEEAGGHPYAKHIEVVGIRLLESNSKKSLVRYTVINHSPVDLSGLELTVTLTETTSEPGAAPLAVIAAKVGAIAAYGVKDMESPLETKLKVYELPDWQFVKVAFEITAPK